MNCRVSSANGVEKVWACSWFERKPGRIRHLYIWIGIRYALTDNVPQATYLILDVTQNLFRVKAATGSANIKLLNYLSNFGLLIGSDTLASPVVIV